MTNYESWTPSCRLVSSLYPVLMNDNINKHVSFYFKLLTSENIINIQMIVLYVLAIPKYKQIIIFILNVSLLPVYVEE